MPQPRWERVAEAIREMIRSDDHRLICDESGARRLPSYQSLREVLGKPKVSTGTVLAAMRQLRAEGWIEEGDSGVSGVRVREDHPA